MNNRSHKIKEVQSVGKQNLLDMGKKQHMKQSVVNDAYNKKLRLAFGASSGDGAKVDPRYTINTAKKAMGAGLIKDIKRRMMKHLPGRTKKTY